MLKTSYLLAPLSLVILILLMNCKHGMTANEFDEEVTQIRSKLHLKLEKRLQPKNIEQEAEPIELQSSEEVASESSAMDDSAKKLSQLYSTIRSVALPQSDTNTQRLVMLLPGKVLNYYDYYPGKAYEAAMENPDHTGMQINIPARVMENMFALADVVPGVDPLHGADTGESLAEMYNNILNWMEIKGFKEKTKEEKKRYLVAVEYLAQWVPDPLNVSVNVTRFNLYRRSQELYNTKRLEMEGAIAAQRRTLSAQEYERWFQLNYNALNSHVEAAYTEWLIFGEKEIVDLYKSYLDVQAPGIDLEDARMALRASGVTSLDRTKTVYPVSFVPSNWYRYLTDVNKVDLAKKRSAQSGDQIRLQIGRLRAKKAMLMALKTATIDKDALHALHEAKKGTDNADKTLHDTAKKAEENRQKCLAKRGCNMSQKAAAVNCGDFTNSSDATSELIETNSKIYSCAESLVSQLNGSMHNEYYNQLISDINYNIDELRKALTMSGAPLSQLAQHAADSQEQLDSQWLQFQFDSSKSSQQRDSSSSSSSSSGFSWWWGSSYSTSSSSAANQYFRKQMNSAKIGVKGELLRVTIQRPWFRPSLFKSNQYHMNAKNLLLSPGDNLPENDFISKAIDPKQKYYLPHYASGLLLSRNVVMEFRELSSSAVYQAIQQSSSQSGGLSVGGFWVISGGHSSAAGRSSSSAKVESSDNGLRITIPGVMIIGYYTQNIPLFPIP